jgi:transcriptional regulator with XRE-family HTH domain
MPHNRGMAQITLEKFAQTVGCHYSTASRFRSGERMPGPELLGRIVSAYSLDPRETLDAYSTGPIAFGRFLRDHVFGPYDEGD